MEAVVDAHDSSERAMGWYYYLEGKMRFPFKARCRLARPISVLRVKQEVIVLGMATEEECEIEMFVWVRRDGVRGLGRINASAEIPSLLCGKGVGSSR